MTPDVIALCIGGPYDSRVYCMPGDRPTKTIAIPKGKQEVIYTVRVWTHPLTKKRYRIATLVNGEPLTDEEITVAIVMGNYAPAWDLN